LFHCVLPLDERGGQPNGWRISRREASAASEAVGWMRMLGGNNYL